jgi:hypothetical protein
MGNWSWLHYSMFFAIYAVTISISIFNISEIIRSKIARKIFLILIISTIGISNAVDIIKNNILMQKYVYRSLMDRIALNVPDGTTVLGSFLYYPAFMKKENKFITYLFLKNQCPDFADEIRNLEVDYVILDDSFKKLSTYWCTYYYYENQIANFLDKNTTFEKEIKMYYPNQYNNTGNIYIFKVKK